MSGQALWLVLSGVLLNAAAQLLLKMATERTGVLELHHMASIAGISALLLQWPMVLGLLCYGVSLLIWLMALSRVEVSLAYPMLALGYVCNAFAAQWLLNEMVSPMRWLGIAIIVLGVIVLSRSA